MKIRYVNIVFITDCEKLSYGYFIIRKRPGETFIGKTVHNKVDLMTENHPLVDIKSILIRQSY